VFDEQDVDRLSSARLAELLSAIEESPWGDLRGKPLDARGLARRLKPYGVFPRSVRLDDGTTPKGYKAEQFADAWLRYPLLPAPERHTATTPMDTGIETIPDPPQDAVVAVTETAPNPHGETVVAVVADTERGSVQERTFSPDLGTARWDELERLAALARETGLG
jgi:hypothetical protein